jgi:hypothetical protein
MEDVMIPLVTRLSSFSDSSPSSSASLARRIARRAFLPLAIAGAVAVTVFVGERDAAAQVVEVAPPSVQIEVVPAPVVGQVWVPGYWGWRPRRGHVWYAGHYVVAHPGYVWRGPRWVQRGRYYHFVPGRWHR